ncbi:1-phosphofructokinase family hexose kinase [Streptomyces boncukensis]|uniref:1-phosphofructokinase family hexose kinase n=1 Tax=Streptomyces boncukensis TaxID=2711219 RepID=A0A6G4X228_9ACTN|nr:1-phosphofructokinase family hexose kinase [Streptomyces boncukensis]NGO71555.1 1-phosphofructokinase family hexose kinase [Streptomyces boncukensis]
MFLTVTLNAALDLTYGVRHLEPHASHRVRNVTQRPGGKGLNVARVLAALGHRAAVTGFVGGGTGRELRALLSDSGGVRDALVPVAGATRRTVGVVDESTGDTTQFNEPGPHISAAEWDSFLATYRDLVRAVDDPPRAVALCGSLPPGVPVGAYAALIREARAAGVPTLLDTSGEPLRRGLAARPELVKPNARELAEITGSTEPLRAARGARRRGARSVAASLGAEGMLLVTRDGTWQAAPAERLPGNPTGAGDSAAAALLSGFAEDLPWPELLTRAVALSAATVASPVAGEFDAPTYARLLPGVRVSEPNEPDIPA